MPSGSKKRRAQRKKEAAAAAAAREKTVNEAPAMASSEEISPVMQTESTDGVTAVFDEPSVALPKRIFLPEKTLASEALDLKRKGTEEGIQENELPTGIHSLVQSLNFATPLETSHADKIDVVSESSLAVAAPCVIQLESKDKDGGSIMSTDVCDFERKVTKGTIGYPVSSEICTRVLDSEFYDAKENLQGDLGGSVTAYDDAAYSVMKDKAVKSLTTEPCDRNLKAAESSNAENAVYINVDFADDQRALEHKEDNAVLKKQDLVTPKKRFSLDYQETAALNEEDVPGKTMEDVVKNKKNAIWKM